jgi:hypothetical protein
MLSNQQGLVLQGMRNSTHAVGLGFEGQVTHTCMRRHMQRR